MALLWEQVREKPWPDRKLLCFLCRAPVRGSNHSFCFAYNWRHLAAGGGDGSLAFSRALPSMWKLEVFEGLSGLCVYLSPKHLEGSVSVLWLANPFQLFWLRDREQDT